MRPAIDFGHGGKADTGAVSPHNGLVERDNNFDVGMRVAERLRRAGIEPILTRKDSDAVSLINRAAIANRAGADIFVSIHFDGSTNQAERGHHVIHSIVGGKSKVLAQHLLDEFSRATRREPNEKKIWSRRGRSGDYYAVIRETKMPAAIIERGYASNKEDASFLAGEAQKEAQAEGIVNGILAYYGYAPQPTPKPSTSTLYDPAALPILREGAGFYKYRGRVVGLVHLKDKVRLTQKVLAHEFNLPVSFIDGLFGKATTREVRHLQRKYPKQCQGADGIVGPKTWNVIIKIARAQRFI